jgi:Golgi SNAP receptor complex protein 2
MTSIGELFPKCRKLAYDARQQWAVVQQQQQQQNGDPSSSDATELRLLLEEWQRQLDFLEELVSRETPSQRAVWKRKLAELRQEHALISSQQQQAAAARMSRTHRRNVEAASDREELFLRRRNRRQQEGDSTERDMHNLAEEGQSLEQSQMMVQDHIGRAAASLQELQDQRRRLKGVDRVLFDIGSRLGLTDSTMRIIERRDVTDAYLVAACMVVTCIVIWLAWF